MKLRTFHKLDGADTGLEVYNNWVQYENSPIRDTDLSLIFNGPEYVDTSADYLAIGKLTIPCLTTDNLMYTCKDLSASEKTSIQDSLDIVTKEKLMELIKSDEFVAILEELGFTRKQ